MAGRIITGSRGKNIWLQNNDPGTTSLIICTVLKLSGKNALMAFGAFTVHVDEIPRFVEWSAAVRANKSQAKAHLLVVLKNSVDSVCLHASNDQEAGN